MNPATWAQKATPPVPASLRNRADPAQKLHQEPDAEKEHRRHFDDPG